MLNKLLKNKFLQCSILAMSQSVLAAPPSTPAAGELIQQIPPAPILLPTLPKVEIEHGSAPPVMDSDSARVTVSKLRVIGAQAYTEESLIALTGFKPESQLTLSDLREMASKISDYYHRNGYFVAQAYLPPQDIKEGIVTITVLDGNYGDVTLRNQSNLSDNLANGLLSGLNKGDLIASAPLESRLLSLSDLPGVKVKSTLIPGASVGASDLIVDVAPGQLVSGSVDADNAGNRYTGANRIGATVNLNNLDGLGDVASLRVLTSGSGLRYARVSYQLQFVKARVGVAYSVLDYVLGKEFASLRANGTSDIASIFGSYPLIRSRSINLNAQLAFDSKTFQDKLDSIPSVTDKKAQVLMASLSGDRSDTIGGAGLSNFSLTWSTGNIDIQTPLILASDAATAQSNGRYNKLGFSAARLQSVTDTVSLYAAINGQYVSKNLDVSEKMELGGMYAVRAYPEGEAYADQGYILTLEARKQLPKFSEQMVGQMQLIGFVDTGTVILNKNPWPPAVGSNSRTLSGAGIGLNWSESSNFVVKAYYARKLGSEMATSAPDAAGRFWIQLVKFF